VSIQVLDRPELVVFDLDNTFYDYQSAHEVALSSLLRNLESISGANSIQILDTYEKARSNVKSRLGITASSHSRLLYLSEYFSLLETKFDTSEILRIEVDYWNTFLKHITAFPGSIAFIYKLLSVGIECALVTDLTSEIQYKKLKSLGLVDKFHYVVTSEEAGGDKSTLLPWKLLDERAEFSKFSTIWYVGDARHDLNPSMRRPQDIGFLKTHFQLQRVADGEFCFSSFEELSSLIN
jgi:FMN phosphatase YigB (HAD superfamily)